MARNAPWRIPSRDPARRPPRGGDRRGTALIIAIVALVLMTAISYSLTRITLAAAEQAERQQWRRQALWLAESALAQTAARLRSDPEFAGDTWDLPLSTSSGAPEGRVVVEVAQMTDAPQQRVITAMAEFPLHPTDRARISRTLTLIVPESPPANPEEP